VFQSALTIPGLIIAELRKPCYTWGVSDTNVSGLLRDAAELVTAMLALFATYSGTKERLPKGSGGEPN